MQIKDLPASTTLASTDMLAKDTSSGTTQKITAGDVVSSIAANNLTTTTAGKVLDARQGKALNDAKVNVSDIANNLTTTTTGKVLDARQGKTLNDTKVNVSDIANNLTTTTSGKVLDATQGVELKVLKLAFEEVTDFTNPFTNSGITSDMYVIHSELSNPSAQLSDWTVTTSTGSLSISGTISGQTNITLYLAHGR